VDICAKLIMLQEALQRCEGVSLFLASRNLQSDDISLRAWVRQG